MKSIIENARVEFEAGRNVTEYLKEELGEFMNSSDIIEVAYDLQSGSYVDVVNRMPELYHSYSSEIARLIGDYGSGKGAWLDAGCGELTCLSNVLQKRSFDYCSLLAFDISWSRLMTGSNYAKTLGVGSDAVLFTADMEFIPLPSNSCSLVTTMHALEPNGGREARLLGELIRVAQKRLVLFEPSFSANTGEGKARMRSHGYIGELADIVTAAGGQIRDKVKLNNPLNQLNPTYCYVIDKIAFEEHEDTDAFFTSPGTNNRLERVEDMWFSHVDGKIYPVIKGMPILRKNLGIIATKFKSFV